MRSYCEFHAKERSLAKVRWAHRPEWSGGYVKKVVRLRGLDHTADLGRPSKTELGGYGKVTRRIFICECGAVHTKDAGGREDIQTCPTCVAKKVREHDTRKRVKGLAIFPYARTDVFERDRWICHLCNEPIDPEIAWPHPRFGSIDHLIPVSKGGEDSIENVRAAHLGCNSSRGNRDLPQTG